MSVDCYYGFGFATDSIDERKVIDFCKNHKDTLNNLKN